jgi:hypothetical protein
LPLTNKQINGFLYAIEGLGAVFVGLFIVVYLAGLGKLPKDVVYHSEPVFRTPLSIIGAVLITLVLAALLISIFAKKTKK